jgi:hypothetical protein
MFSVKHLLMGVYQVCSKIGPAGGGRGGGQWGVAERRGGRGKEEAYIQVSDLRAIMALLFIGVCYN